MDLHELQTSKERKKQLYKMYNLKYGKKPNTDTRKDEIKTSKNLSILLIDIIPEYVATKKDNRENIDDLFDYFIENKLPEISDKIKTDLNKSTNIYNTFGAKKLSKANSVTRSLSTKLGSIWEQVANLSPHIINPEIEFGIKLKGVDAIWYDENSSSITYIQMKTQNNTLTGGNKGSVDEELGVYAKALLAVCIDTDAKSTYNGKIKKKNAKEFWKICGIDYTDLERNIKKVIIEAEKLL